MPRATRPSTARVVRDHERRGSPPTSGGPRSAVRSKWAVSVSRCGQIQMSLLRVALDGVDAAVPGVAARPPGRGGDPDPAGGPGPAARAGPRAGGQDAAPQAHRAGRLPPRRGAAGRAGPGACRRPAGRARVPPGRRARPGLRRHPGPAQDPHRPDAPGRPCQRRDLGGRRGCRPGAGGHRDRGGWSATTFAAIGAAGFDLLTYRKGPFDRLPDTAFTAHTGTDPDGQVHSNYRLAETTVELPLPNRAGATVALR